MDGRAEARLLALAGTTPPLGRTEWTLPRLADQQVELQIVDAVSDETVRRVPKQTRSSRGGRSGGYIAPQADAGLVCAMEGRTGGLSPALRH